VGVVEEGTDGGVVAGGVVTPADDLAGGDARVEEVVGAAAGTVGAVVQPASATAPIRRPQGQEERRTAPSWCLSATDGRTVPDEDRGWSDGLDRGSGRGRHDATLSSTRTTGTRTGRIVVSEGL